MFKNGLKLWAINQNYIKEALSIYEKGLYSYIELYAVPGSFDTYIKIWKNLNIPFVIHAPHFGSGLNFSKKEMFESNIRLAGESLKFADALDSRYIIFHPGVDGDIDETVRQINHLNDSRILIENKPYLGKDNDFVCVGNSWEEIKFIMNQCGTGFCFDIGHSICAANVYKKDPIQNIKDFINLNPLIYHFTDGYIDSPYDEHLHFGEGSYPLKEIVKLIPKNSMVTNEAKKDFKDRLDDFVKDMEFLKSL